MEHTRLALPLLLLLAGCHKDEAAAKYDAAKPNDVAIAKPAVRALADGKEMTAEGVSLTFPKDWVAINLTKGQLDDMLKGMRNGPNGPAMAKTIETVARSGAFKMFAFDPKHSKPGFVNNANLVITPAGNATLDQALDQGKQQVAQMGIQATTSKVDLPAGQFGKVESRMKMPNGADVASLAFVKVEDGKMIVVTFTCPPEQAGEYAEKAKTIMATFHR